MLWKGGKHSHLTGAYPTAMLRAQRSKQSGDDGMQADWQLLLAYSSDFNIIDVEKIILSLLPELHTFVSLIMPANIPHMITSCCRWTWEA